MLGINAFYDYRKTLWGTKHIKWGQWGVGAELMAELNILESGGGLGLTSVIESVNLLQKNIQTSLPAPPSH